MLCIFRYILLRKVPCVYIQNIFNHFSQNELKSRTRYRCYIKPLKAELNPICHLLALLGAHHIFHVSSLTVNLLTNDLTQQFFSTLYGSDGDILITNITLFSGLCPSPNFFKEGRRFGSRLCFRLQTRKAPNLLDPWSSSI
jgi:hypothetical protein